MELATASRVSSGEYAIFAMEPLPRRRVAPSGNPHRAESSWAVAGVSAIAAVNSRVKVNNVNFFMWISPFDIETGRSLLLKTLRPEGPVYSSNPKDLSENPTFFVGRGPVPRPTVT